MYTIEVDFEVFKQLTVRRPTEDVSHNDVIRELLGMDQPSKSQPGKLAERGSGGEWVAKGVRFPAGTEFRANYKGETHSARVEGGSLVLGDGQRHDSPSSAAIAITGNSVNGWRFWECRLPGKGTWQLIETLRR